MGELPSEIKGFDGLHVVSFESRRGDQMADLITRHGGQATIAPAMREVPFTENAEALDFGRKVLDGRVDAVVFLTGTGADALFHVLETMADRSQWITAFSKLRLFSRGPKPASVLAVIGLSDVQIVGEPATSKEVLAALEAEGFVQGKTIGIQEYGVPNPELTDALVQRGARVLRVPVYRWALPQNKEPLRQALQSVIGGHADVVLFTNSNQINNVLRFAQEEGLEKQFRDALTQTVVASVGPVCTHFLDEYGLPMDLQPEQPRMDDLVQQASAQGAKILERKRQGGSTGQRVNATPTIETPSQTRRPVDPQTRDVQQSPFMRACRREATDYTPIWLMRQAGRYMKEYRDIRERHGFLDLCKDSDLACEVSVYAAERLGVDAAIIFSDILLILEPMGLQLEYAKGDGPIIHNPVRLVSDIDKLVTLTHPEPLQFVYDAIRKTRRGLPPTVPLIGFCGAPFTLASYMIEGQGSRNFIHTKSLMYQDPAAWNRLMSKITDGLIVYLNAQIAAGAQVVQLFDSWVGCLSPEDYKTYVQPHSRRLIQSVTPGTPVIHFGTQTGTFLELLRDAGGDVIGLDWRVPIETAWPRLGPVAIQGNLDPVILFSDVAQIKRHAQSILDSVGGRPGHIFNLGHGVLPQTPVGHVKALVDFVHEASAGRKTS